MQYLSSILSSRPELSAILGLSLLLVVALFALFSRKGIEISLGGGRSISIGRSGSGSSGCDACKAAISKAATEQAEAIFQIRSGLMFRQLKYAENAMDKIEVRMCDEYANHLLSRNVDGDPKGSAHFEVYRSRVERFVRGHVIPGLRAVYQENHIAEKSDLEWQAHKAHVIETCRMDLCKFIDDEFTPLGDMSRREVEEFHSSRWHVMEAVMHECLDRARMMAKQAHSDIDFIRNGRAAS